MSLIPSYAFLAPLQDPSPVIWGLTTFVLFQLFTTVFVAVLTQSICQRFDFKYLHAKKPWVEEMLQHLRKPVIFILIQGLVALALNNLVGLPVIMVVALKLAAGVFVTRMVQTAHLPNVLEKLLIALVWAVVLLGMTDRFAPFLDAMNRIQVTLGDKSLSAATIVKAFIVFAVFWWIISNTANLLEGELRRRRVKPAARTLLIKLLYIMGLIFAFFITLDTLGIDLAAFALFGGALGIGLGFGLRTIFSNFIAGFILLMDKTIKPGDVISVANVATGAEIFGQVVAMNNRCIVIRQRDGRERMIPNERVVMDEIINWSYSNKLVRQEVYIRVNHKADMEQVREIIITAIKTVPRVSTMPAPNAFIKEFAENGTIFFARFWHTDPEDGVNNVKGDVQMAIWKALRENKIEIPPPQLRLVDLPQ